MYMYYKVVLVIQKLRGMLDKMCINVNKLMIDGVTDVTFMCKRLY